MPGGGFVLADSEYPCMIIMILYSILVYILLFTQAPTPGCLDGTIIDSRIILVTMYYCGYVGV